MERKKNPSAFIRNTYNILQRIDLNHIIAWSQDDQGFIIHDLPKFQTQILPQYFKHQKYTSFVRQLNMYGFHKQRHPLSQNYFQHETFRRGHNLNEIRRKPEKKRRNQQQGSVNQISLQQISERQNLQKYEQQQQDKSLQIKNNQVQIVKEEEQKKNQNQIINQKTFHPIVHSTESILQQAIVQNQIITKLHPYIMLLQLKIKQYRLKQLQHINKFQESQNICQIINNLKGIMKVQNLKIASYIQTQDS